MADVFRQNLVIAKAIDLPCSGMQFFTHKTHRFAAKFAEKQKNNS
jgi:hypothetical protein